jgi:hypothetical protein
MLIISTILLLDKLVEKLKILERWNLQLAYKVFTQKKKKLLINVHATLGLIFAHSQSKSLSDGILNKYLLD